MRSGLFVRSCSPVLHDKQLTTMNGLHLFYDYSFVVSFKIIVLPEIKLSEIKNNKENRNFACAIS